MGISIPRRGPERKRQDDVLFFCLKCDLPVLLPARETAGVVRGSIAFVGKFLKWIPAGKFRPLFLKTSDLARALSSQLGGLRSRLTMYMSGLVKGHFTGVSPAFARIPSLVNSIPWKQIKSFVRGFSMEVANQNLFQSQAMMPVQKEEYIGFLLAKAITVPPTISFNVGGLILHP